MCVGGGSTTRQLHPAVYPISCDRAFSQAYIPWSAGYDVVGGGVAVWQECWQTHTWLLAWSLANMTPLSPGGLGTTGVDWQPFYHVHWNCWPSHHGTHCLAGLEPYAAAEPDGGDTVDADESSVTWTAMACTSGGYPNH